MALHIMFSIQEPLKPINSPPCTLKTHDQLHSARDHIAMYSFAFVLFATTRQSYKSRSYAIHIHIYKHIYVRSFYTISACITLPPPIGQIAESDIKKVESKMHTQIQALFLGAQSCISHFTKATFLHIK